jgi:hypothetical protein
LAVALDAASLVPQQTGVLFMRTQQVQPASTMVATQSQQAWIIWQHCGSPLAQVIVTPFSVGSQRHSPMVQLQVQTVMPFMSTQQLHMPPASMVQRFCTMLQAILSSQTQVIFTPPVHFSSRTVQRGTMSKLVPVGTPVGAPTADGPTPATPSPGMAIPVRSIIIALDMTNSFHAVTAPGTGPGKCKCRKPDLRAFPGRHGIVGVGTCQLQRFYCGIGPQGAESAGDRLTAAGVSFR